MRLAYQKCEVEHCCKPAEVMARDKWDYFMAVCKDCSKKLKKDQSRRKQPPR